MESARRLRDDGEYAGIAGEDGSCTGDNRTANTGGKSASTMELQRRGESAGVAATRA